MGLFTKKLIGIDVGASSIKIVEGKINKNKFHIDRFETSLLPRGVSTDRGINDPDLVSKQIVETLKNFPGKKQSVSTSVKGSGVLTKRILMPKVPEKEIPQQVKWEAEQVFPTDISNILITYQLIGEGKNVPLAPPGTPGWDVLLVGVQKEEASQLRDTIKRAQLNLVVMDLDVLASSDLLDGLLNFPKNEIVALVDVGASSTRMSIRKGGQVIHMREFEIGGNAFTESIASALGLSFEDAEALKIHEGGVIPQEASDALRATLSSWKSELQQCEDLFVSQSDNELIDRWYFFGGAYMTPGLKELLYDDRFASKIVELPLTDLFSFNQKTVDPNHLSNWCLRLITASGLALRDK